MPKQRSPEPRGSWALAQAVFPSQGVWAHRQIRDFMSQRQRRTPPVCGKELSLLKPLEVFATSVLFLKSSGSITNTTELFLHKKKTAKIKPEARQHLQIQTVWVKRVKWIQGILFPRTKTTLFKLSTNNKSCIISHWYKWIVFSNLHFLFKMFIESIWQEEQNCVNLFAGSREIFLAASSCKTGRSSVKLLCSCKVGVFNWRTYPTGHCGAGVFICDEAASGLSMMRRPLTHISSLRLKAGPRFKDKHSSVSCFLLTQASCLGLGCWGYFEIFYCTSFSSCISRGIWKIMPVLLGLI